MNDKQKESNMQKIKKIQLKNFIKSLEQAAARSLQGLELKGSSLCGPHFREINGKKEKSLYCHLGVSKFDFIKLAMTFDLAEISEAIELINKDQWESSELLMYSQNYSFNKTSRLIEKEYHYTRNLNNYWSN
jgi:hypothetical protein